MKRLRSPKTGLAAFPAELTWTNISLYTVCLHLFYLEQPEFAHYRVFTSSPFRHVIIRRPDSARARQSTGSSAEAKGSMSPMEWLRPSILPATHLDLLYQSVSPAALRSEVGERHLSQINPLSVVLRWSWTGKETHRFRNAFSFRCVCISSNAVPSSSAGWLPRSWPLHVPARQVTSLLMPSCSQWCLSAKMLQPKIIWT